MSRHSWKALVWIVALGLVVRLGFAISVGNRVLFPLQDQQIYLRLAESLCRGTGLTLFKRDESLRAADYPAWKLEVARLWAGATEHPEEALGMFPYGAPTSIFEPLMPLLVCTAAKLSGGVSPLSARAVSVIAGTAAILLLFAVGKDALGERWHPWALVAAAWFALYPLHVYYSSMVTTEALYTTGLLATLWAFYRVLRRHRWQDGIVWGLAGGLTFLARSGVALHMLVLGILALTLLRRKALLPLGVAVLAFGLAVSPWVVRNERIHGEPVLMPTKGGLNIWMRNSPEVMELELRHVGFGLPDGFFSGLKRMDLAPFPEFSGELEPERDRILRSRALRFLAANPAYFLRLCRIRLGWYLAVIGKGMDKPLYRVASVVTYGPALLLGLLGMAVGLRREARRRTLPLTLVWLASLGAHMVFHGGIRYRLPTDPLLILLAVSTLAWLCGRFRHSGVRGAARPATEPRLPDVASAESGTLNPEP
jgi:hypothetical protein